MTVAALAYCGRSVLNLSVATNAWSSPATSPSRRSFADAAAAKPATASSTSSRRVVASANVRLLHAVFLHGGCVSRSTHASPRSSSTVRCKATVPRSRACPGGNSAKSRAVRTPSAANRLAHARPTPQTSSTGSHASTRRRSASLTTAALPPVSAKCFFAYLFAAFASVLVGPKPTPHGMPVQRRAASRSSRPNASKPPASPATPPASAKLSSML